MNNVLYGMNRILISSILMVLTIQSVNAQQDKFKVNPAVILQGTGPLMSGTHHKHNPSLGYGPIHGTDPLEGANPNLNGGPMNNPEIFNFVPPLQGANPLESVMAIMGLVQTIPMLPTMMAMLPDLNVLMGPIETSGIPYNPIMTISPMEIPTAIPTGGGLNPPPNNPPTSNPPITYGPPTTPLPPTYNCGACKASPN